MKKIFLLLSVFLVGVPSLLAQNPTPASDTVVEEIVARVNNSIITRADVRKARQELYSEAQQQNSAQAEQQAKDHEKDI